MKKNLYISIVIRTYNEEKNIRQVLESINQQSYNNYEIIIVDSESTDNTVMIAKEYGAKIIHIKKKDFNYSYSSNIGVSNSIGEVVCFLSGHSVPLRNDYLAILNNVFQDDQVGGCYGDVLALKDGSLTEKMFNFLGYLKNKFKGQIVEKEIHPGILSCSNASIRKEIWNNHQFVEQLGDGGEDVEMAYYILKNNKKIIFCPNLIVRHSHGKKFFDFIKELKKWNLMYKNVLDYIDKSYQ
nr:glycosyltransferase [uncultured Romboutsia sp.]